MHKEEFCFARPHDVQYLHGMYLKKTRQLKEKGIMQWDEEYVKAAYSKNQILKHVQKNEYAVLKAGGIIISALTISDESDKQPNAEPDCKYIDRLVSDKPGAGKKLLLKTMEHCRQMGVKKIRLDCQDQNDKLKKYYLDIGFAITGKIKHKHFKGRHSCLMEYNLKKLKTSLLCARTARTRLNFKKNP